MNSPSSTFGFVDPTDFIDLNNSTDFRDIYVIGKAYDNSPKFQASWDPNNGTQSLVIFNEVPAGAVYNPWGQSVDSGYSMLFKSSPSALTSGGQTWNKMNGIKLTGFGDPNSMYSGGAVRVDAVFKCNRP
jgi:hypothetical protein